MTLTLISIDINAHLVDRFMFISVLKGWKCSNMVIVKDFPKRRGLQNNIYEIA